jgi:hypothetical protein
MSGICLFFAIILFFLILLLVTNMSHMAILQLPARTRTDREAPTGSKNLYDAIVHCMYTQHWGREILQQ